MSVIHVGRVVRDGDILPAPGRNLILMGSEGHPVRVTKEGHVRTQASVRLCAAYPSVSVPSGQTMDPSSSRRGIGGNVNSM